MINRVRLRLIFLFVLGVSILLTGCGTADEERTKDIGTASTIADTELNIGKYDVINKARAADVESAKLISAAVYEVLADEKVFDEVYASLNGKILAWANAGQRFEDGGAGHERFLMALNSSEKLAGGAPGLQYKEQLLGTGNFVPEGWAIAYVGGKVEVYVVGKIYDWGVSDYTSRVEVYPNTDDNYKEKIDTGDVYRDAKDADLRSAGDMVTVATAALASEAAYDEVYMELDSGRIIAWAKEGGEFEDGGRGFANYVKELNLSYKYKGGTPLLQYKEKILAETDFIPGGWAIALKNNKPVIYITDGTMTKNTINSTPKVEMQPDVDFNYK